MCNHLALKAVVGSVPRSPPTFNDAQPISVGRFHLAPGGITKGARAKERKLVWLLRCGCYCFVITCDTGYPLIVPTYPYPATVVPVMQVIIIIPPGAQSA